MESLYFDYTSYPFQEPPELAGESARHPVVIVGGGPVGLAVALGLVRRGVPVTVIHPGNGVGYGSRAAGTTRRSLEILSRLGCIDPFMKIGVHWQGLRSFVGDQLVLERHYPPEADQQFPRFLNVQQCYTEQFLLDELLDHPLCDLRWSSTLVALEQTDEVATLEVECPSGSYRLEADWVLACDGAHSTVRQQLGLRYEGTSYAAQYVIMDIQIDTDLPAYRHCWFNPPAFPESTVLMHKQPSGIWRIDYQLGGEDSLEEEIEGERATERANQHLAWLGLDHDWKLDCLSGYRARALSLPDYRNGRVVFVGDAAHLVPIFGIRGLNSGLEDVANLVWKLPLVLDGTAGPELLDSYSYERHDAALQNHASAKLSARFMSPGGPGPTLVRDAVLSLALDRPSFAVLLDPRQSAPVGLASSPTVTTDSTGDDDPLLGQVIPDVRMPAGGYLLDALAADFTLLVLGEDTPVPDLDGLDRVVALRLDGKAAAALGAAPATRYLLVRPDQYVTAAWADADGDSVGRAYRRAIGAEWDGSAGRPDAATAAPDPVASGTTERAWLDLSDAVDGVAEADQATLLAKVALLAAERLDSPDAFAELCRQAVRHLAAGATEDAEATETAE